MSIQSAPTGWKAIASSRRLADNHGNEEMPAPHGMAVRTQEDGMRLHGMAAAVVMVWCGAVVAADVDATLVGPGDEAAAPSVSFKQRAATEPARQLRQDALQKRAAYEAALGALPEVAAIDADVASTKTDLDRLVAERRAAAEQNSGSVAVLRDAWIEARDHLLDLRKTGAPEAQMAAARQEADARHTAFRRALAEVPAVRERDAKIAAARDSLSQLYVQRRKLEQSSGPALADVRQARDVAERAYVDYVYRAP